MGKGPDHAKAKDGEGKKKKAAGQARELRARGRWPIADRPLIDPHHLHALIL